jgi:hypothetical protein
VNFARVHAAAAVTVAVVLGACANGSTPEQQVRAQLAAAQRHAEARDLSALLNLVAEEYSDARGQTKAELRDFLRALFILNQSLHLLVRIDSVSFPADELARVAARVGMLRTRAGDAEDWDLAAEIIELDLEMLNEGGEWRVLHSRWRRLGDGD